MATKEKVVEEIVDNIDKAVEVVTEAVELVDPPKGWVCRLSRKQHIAQLVGVGVISAAVAGFVVYKVLDKKLQTKYDEIAKKEIAEAKTFYNKKARFDTPEEAARELIPEMDEAATALEQYQGKIDMGREVPLGEKTVVAEEVVVNIFEQPAAPDRDGWDHEAEMRNRSPLHPYILHEEEYMDNDPKHKQMAITYFQGDGVLADEDDQPIPDIDKVVGEANLQHFGHGAGDPRVLFVRNDRLNADFEIALHDGKYSHEIMGMQHSDDIKGERMIPRHSRDGD